MSARLDAALAELAAAIRDEVTASATRPAATDGPPALLSTTDAARRLAIGRSALYGLIAEGELRTIKVGRRRLVPADALAEFVQAQGEAASSHREAAPREERRVIDAPT